MLHFHGELWSYIYSSWCGGLFTNRLSPVAKSVLGLYPKFLYAKLTLACMWAVQRSSPCSPCGCHLTTERKPPRELLQSGVIYLLGYLTPDEFTTLGIAWWWIWKGHDGRVRNVGVETGAPWSISRLPPSIFPFLSWMRAASSIMKVQPRHWSSIDLDAGKVLLGKHDGRNATLGSVSSGDFASGALSRNGLDHVMRRNWRWWWEGVWSRATDGHQYVGEGSLPPCGDFKIWYQFYHSGTSLSHMISRYLS